MGNIYTIPHLDFYGSSEFVNSSDSKDESSRFNEIICPDNFIGMRRDKIVEIESEKLWLCFVQLSFINENLIDVIHSYYSINYHIMITLWKESEMVSVGRYLSYECSVKRFLKFIDTVESDDESDSQ